jgi:hypothetical protein
MRLGPYLKALYAAVGALLGSLELASVDGHFTARELIHAALLALTVGGVTWGVPNIDVSRDPVTGRYVRH